MKKIVLAVWMVVILAVTLAYAAIQGDFVINVVDSATSTKFYRVPGSIANGMRVDVTRVTGNVNVIGASTPADAFANPTTAISAWSLNGLYNGSTWDFMRESAIGAGALLVGGNSTPADAFANPTAANVNYTLNAVWNGTTWDRYKGKTYNHLVQAGAVSGAWGVNKFGVAPSGVQTTATDIWDRADATPTQQIWLAPTAARVHAIVSSSADDDGSPTGIGARTLTVYGLTAWSATAETSETVTLNGTGAVNTSNSYVIIHRMKTATTGTGGPNVGTITATAAAPDSTITAAILPGNGNTEMAIYGVPTKTAYITQWCVNLDKASVTAATVDFQLRVNETPASQTVAFHRKDDISVQSTGTNQFCKRYDPPYKIVGPAIIKVQGMASDADIDGESGFDLIIE